MRRNAIVVVSLLSLAATQAAAQEIAVHVDAREAPRRLLHVSMTVPAPGGPVTLLYPRWIPGEHGPTGPIGDIAGLRITAGGSELAWRRVPDDMNAFEVAAPAGVREIQVVFDLLSPPPSAGQFTSGASLSAKLAVLNWNQLILYPAGRPAREIRFSPSLTLPEGWRFGTALRVTGTKGGRVAFRAVTLETLVDSPVIAGEHFRRVPVGPADGPPHFLELAADSAEALEAPAELSVSWDRLVREALAMFRSTHYEEYHFLVALSDVVAHFGLEHHESSDNRVPERTWLEESLRRSHATLLPHELVHSWNGKFRRPADMIPSDFQRPVRTNLLWVYEGLTQYLGQVLAARSGLWTADEYRDKLALMAQWAADQTGRSWRPLEDTAVSAQVLFPARRDWRAARRGTDFYDEGALIWLDADTLIRKESKGRRSLEDFLRRFHGGASGPAEVRAYRLEDLVRVLGEVHSNDWSVFFERRAAAVSPRPPVEGLERAGWRLSYADKPSTLQKSYDDEDKQTNLSASIGLVVGDDGAIKDVVPGTPADVAGIGPAMKLVAVNGRRFTKEILRAGVAATRGGASRLELLVENAGFFSSHALDYAGGERYPRLERIAGADDLLSEITRGAEPRSDRAAPRSSPGRSRR